jgi:RimJ/RimL family protein N-acetyltransferase
MIYGDRIRFRHPERDDVPQFQRWLNDPEVREGLALFLPMSLAEEEQWFEEMLKSPKEEMPFCIEIRSPEPSDAQSPPSWTLIGNCAFFALNWRRRSAEIGIFIGDKRCWNQGYGTEAMQLLLQHGFGTLNLHRIMLRVYDFNLRAQRAYEKSGFVLEGRLREANYHHGKYVDELLMSVLRPEWEAKQP